jgi:hypothetical protein
MRESVAKRFGKCHVISNVQKRKRSRRNAEASLPPHSGVPCTTDRAETISLYPFPLAISLIHSRLTTLPLHSVFPFQVDWRRKHGKTA